jgi:hypothetical protein
VAFEAVDAEPLTTMRRVLRQPLRLGGAMLPELAQPAQVLGVLAPPLAEVRRRSRPAHQSLPPPRPGAVVGDRIELRQSRRRGRRGVGLGLGGRTQCNREGAGKHKQAHERVFHMTSKIVDTTADAGQGRAAGARAADVLPALG